MGVRPEGVEDGGKDVQHRDGCVHGVGYGGVADMRVWGIGYMEGRVGVGERESVCLCWRVIVGKGPMAPLQAAAPARRLGVEELGRPAELSSCGGVAPCLGLRRDSLSPGPGN